MTSTRKGIFDWAMYHGWRFFDDYMHGRDHCGVGRAEALRRAAYSTVTGRWPW